MKRLSKVPVYEFLCLSCDRRFDKLQNYDAQDPLCPLCDGKAAKLLSAPSFVLKGGGWYKDGYSKNSSKSKTSD